MCGRINQRKRDSEELQAEFYVTDIRYTHNDLFNICPSEIAGGIIGLSEKISYTRLRFGLIPRWAKDPLSFTRTFNARSETVFIKPVYRECILRRRALIPVDSWFEWTKDKIPFMIQSSDTKLLSLAALWDTWKNPKNGENINSMSIITMPSHVPLSEIHSRQPLVVPPPVRKEWLNPEITDTPAVQRMVENCVDHALSFRITQVSTEVNNGRNKQIPITNCVNSSQLTHL